jgi:hypothetical protein
MAQIGYKEVRNQSRQVWGHYGKKWLEHAEINAKLPRIPASAFINIGLGKTLLCVAMGESLEANIDTIKKYRDRFDILTCDKGFGKLLDHGIKADYVELADAAIDYDKWLKPYIDQTKGVKLISTVYANPAWTTAWQGEICFYMNKDAIASEKHFAPMFGDDMRVIPASSNVSNAMVVFMTGCDEYSRVNYSGYQRIFLIGYDYSWRPDGNYYAWDNPIPKRHYMAHRVMMDINGDVVWSSENLVFSAQWLTQYVNTFGLPVINLSGRGILDIPMRGNMEQQFSRLNADKRVPGIVGKMFKSVVETNAAFVNAEANFNKMREELIWQ